MNIIKFTTTLLMAMVMAASPLLASASVLTPSLSSADSDLINKANPQVCLSSIDASIAETEGLKFFLNPRLVAADAAVIGGSIAIALPTALASLPAAATVLAARNLGAATYKEAKLSSQGRAKQIVLDSVVYLQFDGQNGEEDISSYPALQELVVRVNGPINSLIGRGYSAEQVAEMVLKASQDESFCSKSGNHRLVHFKDYVLSHIES